MLKDIRKDCIKYAQLLGDYQSMSCNQLADGYCKALDEEDGSAQNKYLSALVLRFWYTIDKMYQACPGVKLDHEDFFSWLVEAINYACKDKYRAWQKPEKHTNAQAAINQCINTIRLQHYYDLNLDKNRANYGNVSLDNVVGYQASDDKAVTLGETLSNTDYEDTQASIGAETIVQSFINKKKIIDAIIIDTIAFNDVERYTKKIVKTVDEDGKPYKYTKQTAQFWPYKLVQLLGSLPENYQSYFSGKYKVVTSELSACLGAIRQANNQKLYKYVKSCQQSLKQALLS